VFGEWITFSLGRIAIIRELLGGRISKEKKGPRKRKGRMEKSSTGWGKGIKLRGEKSKNCCESLSGRKK